MMFLNNAPITLISCLMLLHLLVAVSEGKTAGANLTFAGHNNFTNGSVPSSKWLRQWRDPQDARDPGDPQDPRRTGCRGRPWICNRGERPPFRMRCCRNQCVDITSNVNHCGLCAIRCPYNWQCCRGLCRNINVNPLHCGRCFNRCPFGIPCVFGLCGYARPLPPLSPRPRPSWPSRTPVPFPPRTPSSRPQAYPTIFPTSNHSRLAHLEPTDHQQW